MPRLFQWSLALVLTALFTLTACDSGGPEEPALGTMEATIDGSPWSSSLARAVEFTFGGRYELSISGTRFGTASSSVSLSLRAERKREIVQGTYRIGGAPEPGVIVQGSYIGPQDILLTDTSTPAGTLTIQAITDLTVRGTFSFSVSGRSSDKSVQVTDGAFYVSFLYVSFLPLPDEEQSANSSVN